MTYYIRDWAKDAAFIRRARKVHRCCGGHNGEQRVPCALPIKPGELYVEYCGESHPYMSGDRHHLTCAEQHGLVAPANDQGTGPSSGTAEGKNPHAVALGRRGGKAGRGAYLRSLTPEQLREHQRQAAEKRWADKRRDQNGTSSSVAE